MAKKKGLKKAKKAPAKAEKAVKKKAKVAKKHDEVYEQDGVIEPDDFNEDATLEDDFFANQED